MRDKLYFITDAHLGMGADSAERERQLCRLIDSIREEAAMVVLLGDMFDFWFTYRHVVPRGGIRLLGRLAELADAGVELHYFVGNHDMWMFDYLTSEMAITMHDDPDYLTFDGKRFLVGHGDGLGHLDKHYDRLRRIFRNRLNQRLFALLPEWLSFGIATGWSRSSRQSHERPSQVPEQDRHRGIVLYCQEQLMQREIDYCVFGHLHMPTARQVAADNGNKALYVNAGDWLNHRTYAVYSPAEGLQWKSWEEK